MDLVYLLILFAVLIVLMARRVPLYAAMGVSLLLGFLLYRVPLSGMAAILSRGLGSRTTLYLLLAFYVITFLQRVMEKRRLLVQAERSMTRLFGSRRINATAVPFVIGLLPAVGAVLMARPIVDAAAGEDLDIRERCFVTSFHRHISESFLPTYPSIILAMELSGVSMPHFVLGMLPLVAILFLLAFLLYVRKIPKTQREEGVHRREEVLRVLESLWPILASIALILGFRIPVYLAVLPVLLLTLFINRLKWSEIRPMFVSAFETRLMLTTAMVMVFKELLEFTGVIQSLPAFFQGLPLAPVIIFGLIFFFGTVLAGSQAMIAMMLPVAIASLGSSLGLLIFLQSMAFIGSQISLTHVCLAVITESYELPFTALIEKTIPIVILFILLSSLYSYGLFLFF